MSEIVFSFIALSTCIFAFLTVRSRHIFHSAIWLTFCLMNIAGIYFFLNAQFLGVIQVLVYIGGIITLFIFAIKLTAHIDDPSIRQVNEQVIPSTLAVAALCGMLFYIIGLSPWAGSVSGDHAGPTLKDLGQSLMTKYILPFEYISVVLLAVMIGAIVIGKVKK